MVERPVLAASVTRDAKGPYESDCLKGRLAARSRAHVAFVESARVGTKTMVALAAVALRNVGD